MERQGQSSGSTIWGWVAAFIAIFAWSVTFANTRALLGDFSSLEIMIVRFSLAWALLQIVVAFRRENADAMEAIRRGGRLRVELLCLGLGAAGIVIYQLMENCAIYYTGAGNVAILVAFGPIATAVMAKVLRNDKHLTVPFLIGSLIAVAGVAILMSNDKETAFRNRILGDAMALVAMMMWGVYSVIVDKIRSSGKKGYGFDAYNEKYVDMVEAGIVDPTKVTRSALQNAASVAAIVLTTEALVVNQPEKEQPAPAGGMGGGMGGMY